MIYIILYNLTCTQINIIIPVCLIICKCLCLIYKYINKDNTFIYYTYLRK